MPAELKYMRLALALARRAEGRTSPNPPVGAVVVKDGRIVGQGWHHQAGSPHAEPLALAQAGERAAGGDLYVTLEPCNHHGRTPPCAEAVLAAGIKRVFVSVPDPNPRVKGGGLERLKQAGVEVELGLLTEPGRRLLLPFATRSLLGRPWVSLKLALSLDGKIATARGRSEWLTGPKAKAWVHGLRNVCEAVLVGRGTVEIDDPALTTRLPRGRGQNPLRVVLDSGLSLGAGARVVIGPKDGGPAGGGCLVLAAEGADPRRINQLTAAGAEVKVLPSGPDGLDLAAALAELGRRGVMRLLVEGGPTVAAGFFRAGLVDEVFFILTPRIIGGREAPGAVAGEVLACLDRAVNLSRLETRRLGQDLLVRAEVIRRQG